LKTIKLAKMLYITSFLIAIFFLFNFFWEAITFDKIQADHAKYFIGKCIKFNIFLGIAFICDIYIRYNKEAVSKKIQKNYCSTNK